MFKKCIFILLLLSVLPVYAAVNVVVTINPIYALTKSVMQGVAEPVLLVAPGASPHSYALRPSQVKNLNDADLVIWVGEELETFLTQTLAQLPQSVHRLALLKVEHMDPLRARRSNTWQADADHGHNHAHSDWDPHIWLDPVRAQVMVNAIAEKLSQIDPLNQQQYMENAKRTQTQLMQLDQMLQKNLATIQDKPYIVFHDAYQYFEKRYNLHALGAVTVNPEIMPSAHKISELQKIIKTSGAKCIFAEPQFKPAIVDAIAKATGVQEGVLDPLGLAPATGEASYAQLLENLSTSLRSCLSH